MFWSSKKHRLRRSSRTPKPLRWHYQAKEPKSHHRYYTQENPRPYLTTLPPELHLSIFDTLDPVSSTCLGLTTKRFYPMHHSYHPKVGLYEGHEAPLSQLLQDWNPDDLVLDWESERLVSRERYEILEEARRRERERRVEWYQSGRRDSNGGYGRERDGERLRDDGYGGYGYGYRVANADPYDGRRKLRRRGRLERHDIWTWGRRR